MRDLPGRSDPRSGEMHNLSARCGVVEQSPCAVTGDARLSHAQMARRASARRRQRSWHGACGCSLQRSVASAIATVGVPHRPFGGCVFAPRRGTVCLHRTQTTTCASSEPACKEGSTLLRAYASPASEAPQVRPRSEAPHAPAREPRDTSPRPSGPARPADHCARNQFACTQEESLACVTGSD
jgi:hypothetical protein